MCVGWKEVRFKIKKKKAGRDDVINENYKLDICSTQNWKAMFLYVKI